MTQLLSQITQRGVAHQTTAPSLELVDVSVTYGNGRSDYALQDVTFQIRSGELVAVVGPNGAGKSTLFKLIVGTIQPEKGAVHVYGKEPGGHICIGYVPQRNQIDWSFPVTVEDVVMMGRVGQIGLFRYPKRRDWELVRRSLARVGAEAYAQKQIGALSGGQQQRVFIARALAQEAEMLLLDEPLTGLDLPSQEAILQILTGLQPEGVSVLVATHDLNLAAEQFDRVMLLNRRLIAFGAATAVLTTDNLLHAYGGHLHRIGESIVVADGCCGEEPFA